MPTSSDASENMEGRAEESALWAAFVATRSLSVREKLFLHHANFARNIARRHFREKTMGDLDIHDLTQLAYAGLLEALDRFNPSQGVPFRPFAAHRISGSIRDGIVCMNEVREQISWRHRMRRERIQSISASPETQDSFGQLVELVVGLALGFMLEGTSLFVNENEGPRQLQTLMPTAYDTLAWKELVIQLRRQLELLPERERLVLEKHYVEGMNFDNIAALLTVTKGRVSQLHHAALRLLRKRLSSSGHFRVGSIRG